MFLTFFLGTNNKIFNGICVEGIDIGGLTRSEAQTVLEENLSENVITKNITLFFGDYENDIALSSVIDSLDYAKIAREAKQIGRTGNLFKRYKQVFSLMTHDTSMNLKYTVNMSKLRTLLYAMKDVVDRKAVDATCKKEHGKDFVITDEVYGIELNVPKSIDYVREIIEDNTFKDTNYRISLIADKIDPKVTSEYFKSYSCMLSSYFTEYKRDDVARINSLTNAAKKLDGTIVEAGEEFSFNAKMGKTKSLTLTNKNGVTSLVDTSFDKEPDLSFLTKEERANIKTTDTTTLATFNKTSDLINVQIASTLYNSVLLAGLEVTDRTNCMTLPGYVDICRDALVYENTDFKFKNTTTAPIYIECYVSSGKLFVKLYGNEKFKIYDGVIFKSKVTKVTPPLDDEIVLDPEVEEGDRVVVEQGKSGYSAILYASYKITGKKDKEIKINESEYLPTSSIINVGPGGLEKQSENDITKITYMPDGTVIEGN
ncbi:MAG: VanW family protein [Clostridia bacterium]|nr:VanW family protein [Clostridia bacterium]